MVYSTSKLYPFQVANLACSMSSNEEGVKMVRLAAAEIEKLCPQVKLAHTFRVVSNEKKKT